MPPFLVKWIAGSLFKTIKRKVEWKRMENYVKQMKQLQKTNSKTLKENEEIQKDIAIGYDRLYILKDGIYEISYFGAGEGPGGAAYVQLRINDVHIHASEMDGENIRANVGFVWTSVFKRGDYIQIRGLALEATEDERQVYQIKKIS